MYGLSKLTDALGVPVPDSAYSMEFKLFDAETGGNQLGSTWSKTVSTNAGVFSTQLDGLQSSVLTGPDAWLEVKVGADPPLPRVKLASAPFALRAGDLAMPFSKTVSSSSPAFSVTNSGSGRRSSRLCRVNQLGGTRHSERSEESRCNPAVTSCRQEKSGSVAIRDSSAVASE